MCRVCVPFLSLFSHVILVIFLWYLLTHSPLCTFSMYYGSTGVDPNAGVAAGQLEFRGVTFDQQPSARFCWRLVGGAIVCCRSEATILDAVSSIRDAVALRNCYQQHSSIGGGLRWSSGSGRRALPHDDDANRTRDAPLWLCARVPGAS